MFTNHQKNQYQRIIQKREYFQWIIQKRIYPHQKGYHQNDSEYRYEVSFRDNPEIYKRDQ